MPRTIRFALAGVGGRHRLRDRGQREGLMEAVADRVRSIPPRPGRWRPAGPTVHGPLGRLRAQEPIRCRSPRG